jgi:hypothetical protein
MSPMAAQAELPPSGKATRRSVALGAADLRRTTGTYLLSRRALSDAVRAEPRTLR